MEHKKITYQVPDYTAVKKPSWSVEYVRQATLINCQIENPTITYQDIWGKQEDK